MSEEFAYAEPAPVPKRRGAWAYFAARRFLFISILAHVLFGILATIWVVQTIQAKRKLTFTAAPPSSNPSKRAEEHSVQMAQKRKTMSAPVQAKRILTTATNVNVALPQMPSLPMTSIVNPMRMAGMSPAGFGLGAGIGGSGGPGGDGGGPVPSFGFRGKHEGALVGVLYDLKQTPDRQQTPIGRDSNSGAEPTYYAFLKKFVSGGWNESDLDPYYHSETKLGATQIYIPIAESGEAAKAFNVQDVVQGDRWIVIYKGRISAPRDGTFRFIGRGDNVLLVRLDEHVVFDGSWTTVIVPSAVTSQNNLGPCSAASWQLAGGSWFTVNQGQKMDIEVMIGDSGGAFSDFLLIEEQGVTYDKRSDAPQYPAYPLFQTAKGAAPPPSLNAQWQGLNPETAKTPILFPGMPAGAF